jgi:hypothetical protein
MFVKIMCKKTLVSLVINLGLLKVGIERNDGSISHVCMLPW